MKTLKKVSMLIALIALFASCKPNTDPKQILADKEAKKGIIAEIANNTETVNEMMEVFMNNEKAKMVMLGNEKLNMMVIQNHGTIMKIMKDNPDLMQSMMNDMMEACKNDPQMMTSMCNIMMENKPMMEMMQKMKGDKKGNMDMKNIKKK
jgi:hypothetical protein